MFFSNIKMGYEILTFDNIEIAKNKFYRHKSAIFGGDVNIDKVSVSKKISFGQKHCKYFITFYFTCIIIIKHLLM